MTGLTFTSADSEFPYVDYYDIDEARKFWDFDIIPRWAYEEIGRERIRHAMRSSIAEQEKAKHDLEHNLYSTDDEKEHLQNISAEGYLTHRIKESIDDHMDFSSWWCLYRLKEDRFSPRQRWDMRMISRKHDIDEMVVIDTIRDIGNGKTPIIPSNIKPDIDKFCVHHSYPDFDHEDDDMELAS